MNETVKEWVDKAEGDYATAGRELRARERPNYDAVCFHAQQCAEKLIKGLLIQLGVLPPKIHDLIALSELLSGPVPDWSWSIEELLLLNRAAVAARYPGESADLEQATAAYEIATRMRISLLGLYE